MHTAIWNCWWNNQRKWAKKKIEKPNLAFYKPNKTHRCHRCCVMLLAIYNIYYAICLLLHWWCLNISGLIINTSARTSVLWTGTFYQNISMYWENQRKTSLTTPLKSGNGKERRKRQMSGYKKKCISNTRKIMIVFVWVCRRVLCVCCVKSIEIITIIVKQWFGCEDIV